MNPRLIVLCLPLVLFLTIVAHAQSQSEIIYTGRLLGYFRTPSLQKNEPFKGCYAKSKEQDSAAASEFFARIEAERQRYPNAILVGTGDNFAPQLEARMFFEPESTSYSRYPVANKEFYFGDGDKWIFYRDLKNRPGLRTDIQNGLGTIPTDNVGCFLRMAGYSAIVPGKHDFYFGAERVRQFARLLASTDSKYNSRPVQMLGANLVLKTLPIESEPLDSKIPDDKFREWPTNISVSNLKDGKVVYPWFSFIKIQLLNFEKEESLKNLTAGLKSGSATLDDLTAQIGNRKTGQVKSEDKELNNLLKNADQIKSIGLCNAKRPNEIDINNCEKLPHQLSWSGTRINVTLVLPDKYHGRGNHFSTLLPGKNFGLCIDVAKVADKPTRACIRFSTNRPLFSYPHDVAEENANGITDPEPFVVTNNVALFGVVDPNLNEQVGILNYGWKNMKDELTTRVSAEDPKEALTQQLDYFERLYPGFKGLKVLLVQATPPRAKALAAGFGGFSIIVTAADQEQGTSETLISSTWKPGQRAGSFLGVPTPYYDTATKQGTVRYGVVTATSNNDNQSWSLASSLPTPYIPDKKTNEQVKQELPVEEFWKKVKALPDCMPSKVELDPDDNPTNDTYLKLLVLCSLREYLGTDIALIQSRDLFDQIPMQAEISLPLQNRKTKQAETDAKTSLILQAQMLVDRLIWKGDLATLLYVPGSALKKVLKQSETFASEENSTFALSVEKGRALEKLGVFKKNDEYLVNGLAIEDKNVYSIATTDYIGAGDTGYPDLVKEALNPRTHPSAFSGRLVPISSLVCQKVVFEPGKSAAENQRTYEEYCLPKIISSDYIDETIAAQTLPFEKQSFGSRVWDSTAISWPNKAEDATTTIGLVEQKVQRRGFWWFSLRNASFGFKDLDNNHTDDDLASRFGGVPTSQVNSKEERTYTLGVDGRVSYSAFRREFYLAGGIDYERNSLGDPTTPFTINQKKNKLYGDVGYIFWRRPGRALPNIGAVLSIHGETQLDRPFSTFTLGNPVSGTKDKIQIEQDRSLTLTFRPGFRWENKKNNFEIGFQYGREMRALSGYTFTNGGQPLTCLVDSAKTLADCIKAKSTPPNGPITKDWSATAIQEGRPRAGGYWLHIFSIPITDKMKYEVNQDADFFFVNFHEDTSIDTRFRYSSKNRLSFMIWQNFSIGPTLDLFLFQNKRNKDWLFQRQIGFEAKFSFDLINLRDKGEQATHKP